jgi:hypothetical protein
MKDLIDAVPNRLMADIVADNRPRPQHSAQLTAEPVKKAASGWIDPVPLAPPSGVDFCDAQMNVQDVLDRRELEKRLKK